MDANTTAPAATTEELVDGEWAVIATNPRSFNAKRTAKALVEKDPSRTLRVLDGHGAVVWEHTAVEQADEAVDEAPVDDVPVVDVDDPAVYGEDLGDLADLAVEQEAERVDAEPAAEVEVEVDEHGWAADDQAVEPVVDAEVQGPHTHDECENLETCCAEHLAPVAPRQRAAGTRMDLPEGRVTPVGLTHVLNTRKVVGSREGTLTTQQVYTALLGDSAYPGELVNGRKYVVEVEAGVSWWIARQERIAERHANAEARRTAGGSRRSGRVASRLDRQDVVDSLDWALRTADPLGAVRGLVAELRGVEVAAGE